MGNSLLDTLAMMAQGVGVGAVIAFLVEHIAWFQQLSSDVKWWLILALSISLPLAAQIAVQLVPLEFWASIEPFWRAIAAGFLVWAGSQGTHQIFNKYIADRNLLLDETISMVEHEQAE